MPGIGSFPGIISGIAGNRQNSRQIFREFREVVPPYPPPSDAFYRIVILISSSACRFRSDYRTCDLDPCNVSCTMFGYRAHTQHIQSTAQLNRLSILSF